MTGGHTEMEARRCHHCGREVAETRHRRNSYDVGYYTLYTGEVEPVTRVRGDDSDEVITVLKIVRTMVFTTCADCYRSEAVRAEREQLFRPELAADNGNEEGGAVGSS